MDAAFRENDDDLEEGADETEGEGLGEAIRESVEAAVDMNDDFLGGWLLAIGNEGIELTLWHPRWPFIRCTLPPFSWTVNFLSIIDVGTAAG